MTIDDLCARVAELNSELAREKGNGQALLKHLAKYGLISSDKGQLSLVDKPEWLEKPKNESKTEDKPKRS